MPNVTIEIERVEAKQSGHTAAFKHDETPRPVMQHDDGKKSILIEFMLTPRRYASILLLCEQEKVTFDEALASALVPLFRAADQASNVAR